jgi:hypothetical protein
MTSSHQAKLPLIGGPARVEDNRPADSFRADGRWLGQICLQGEWRMAGLA